MTLPILRPHPPRTSRPTRPAGRRWLAWCGLAILVAVVLPLAAFTDDLTRGQTAGGQLRAALEAMGEAMGQLEPSVHNRVGAEVYLMAQSIGRVLRTLELQPVAAADPALAHDLDYLRDVVLATTSVLTAAGEGRPGSAGPLVSEVERLSDAAAVRLEQIEATLGEYRLRVQGSVIEVEPGPDVVVVRSIDRWLYDGVRYGGVALFLIGLLVLGLRLLALGETELGLLDLWRQAPVVTAAGLLTFTLFMGGAALLAAAPGLLVGRSAETVVLTREPPCRILAAQRSDLWTAEETGSKRLVDVVKARMLPSARDCLGLDSDLAAADAAERFAARRPATAATTVVASAAEANPGPASMQRLETEIDQLLAALRNIVPDLAADASPPPEDDTAVVAAEEAEGAAEPPTEGTAAADTAEEDTAEEDTAEEDTAEEDTAAADTAEETGADGEDIGQGGEFFPVAPDGRSRDLVTTTGVNFRAGPSLDAPRLGSLPEGAQVLFLGEERGWTHIELADGRDAYVASSFLRPAP
jgi:hypothetical protein